MGTIPQSGDELAMAFAAAKTLLDQDRLDDAARLAGRLVRDHGGGEWRVHQLAAVVAQRAGRLPAALTALDRAVAAAPDDAEPYRDRARLLLAMKDFDAAEDAARSATAIAADDVENWLVLGRACRRNGNLDGAEAAFRHARDLDPAGATPDIGLGLVARARNDLPAAEAAYRAALARDPAAEAALFNLANTLVDQGRPEEAVPYFRRALRLAPDAAEVRSNLAKALNDAGEYDEALLEADRAVAIDPAKPAANLNRGMALFNLGSYQEAIETFRRTQEIDPAFAEAHWNEAIAALCLGDFKTGWAKYEYRWLQKEAAKRRSFDLPLWRGEAISDGTVLLWTEQGIGDEILFAGLLQDAPLAPSAIVVECGRRLVPLIKRSFPGLRIIPRGPTTRVPDILPRPTCHAPLAALAARTRTREADFPYHDGHLRADPKRVADIRQRLGGDRRPLIGLSWRSRNPSSGAARTIELAAWRPVLRQQGVGFLNLQYGDCAAELAAVRDATGGPILHDPAIDPLADLDGFAALVAATDLVISIDNSTVHMASALGRPVWTLVPFVPDWRWQSERSDSPWYPSMRLFRQPRQGDWRAVIEAVTQALALEIVGQ